MNLIAFSLLAVVGIKLPTYHLQHERVFAEHTNEIIALSLLQLTRFKRRRLMEGDTLLE